MSAHFTTDSLEAGGIHVDRNISLPAFLELGADPLLTGWPALRNTRSTLETETAKAGWIFFFMAGKIEKSSFGFNRRKSLASVVRRMVRQLKSENCNSFEVMHLTTKHFLGLFRVTLAAHGRRLQEGSVLFGH